MQTQAEMNQTAAREYTKADAELTRVYKQLMAQLTKTKSDKRADLLRDSERAWLKFRDTQALFDASEMQGGSAYPLLHFGSLARTTKARTAELKLILQSEKGQRG